MSLQTRSDDSIDQRTATVGRVGPHLEIKVVDPATGLTVPRGEPGELCTRGYSVMLGYWNQPEKTAEAIDAARWMHTGDIGVMDADGYVSVTGRIKDMVIRGGENIYPREIEEFLYTHPDILDAQVVGVPDDKYGEELMVWIRMREGAEPPRRGFAAGVLHRQARPLQDPALRPHRRRVPDDGHREDPEGRDAAGVAGSDRPLGGSAASKYAAIRNARWTIAQDKLGTGHCCDDGERGASPERPGRLLEHEHEQAPPIGVLNATVRQAV